MSSPEVVSWAVYFSWGRIMVLTLHVMLLLGSLRSSFTERAFRLQLLTRQEGCSSRRWVCDARTLHGSLQRRIRCRARARKRLRIQSGSTIVSRTEHRLVAKNTSISTTVTATSASLLDFSSRKWLHEWVRRRNRRGFIHCFSSRACLQASARLRRAVRRFCTAWDRGFFLRYWATERGNL